MSITGSRSSDSAVRRPGIDARKVLATNICPVMDVGFAGRDGGQIGAGVIRAPRECFEAAMAAHRDVYGAS